VIDGWPIHGWIRRRQAIRRRFNPYVAGMPVLDARSLYGRGPALQRAMSQLEHGDVVVAGERRIGKTSFLHCLRGALVSGRASERLVVPVPVDLECLGGTGLLDALLEETAVALSARIGGPLAAPAGALARCPMEGRPAALVGLLEALCQATGRPVSLVYLIDEIDALADRPARSTEDLAELLDRAPEHARFVLAGTRPPRGLPSGRFERVDLAPLAAEAAEALVRKPVEGVFDYELAAVERILERSQLRPYWVQWLCSRSIEHMHDARRAVVRRTDVDAVEARESH
jgi:hypothetical protein